MISKSKTQEAEALDGPTILIKFARFSQNFMAEGRGDQEQAERLGNPDSERVVFMDWEFTDLGTVGVQCFPLSVGMVMPDGDSIYLELVELGPCNDFVRAEVLPHLTLTDRVPLQEANARIAAWLSTKGPRIVIASDSEYDAKMLRWVVPDLGTLGAIRLVNVLDDLTLGQFTVDDSMRGKLQLELNDGMSAWFLRAGKPRHHALYDAKALCAGWSSIGPR